MTTERAPETDSRGPPGPSDEAAAWVEQHGDALYQYARGRVAGRELSIVNLDKVMYPSTETTKGEVLAYYAQVAPLLLPHVAGRPVTRVRWPHGVEDQMFFEKNLPSGAPSWSGTTTMGASPWCAAA